MRRIISIVATAAATLILSAGVAHAISVYQVVQGGTGVGTFTPGLVAGNGTTPLYTTATTTLVAGTNISFSGGTPVVIGGSPITINSTGSSGSFLSTTSPWTAGQLAEVVSNSTVTSVATGTVSGGTGISVTAGQSIIGSGLTITNSSPLSGLSTSFPLSFSNPTLSWIGLATSSNLTAGQALYATGVKTIASTATTSVSCSGTVSCSGFNVFGGSPITITGAVSGLATSSPIANSNLLVYSSAGAGSAYGVATSTLTASSPLTGSFTHVGSSGSLGCQTASGSQAGCLSSADWTTFNSKQAALTFTYPLVNTTNTISLAFGTTTANSWSALQQFNGNASTTQLSVSGTTYFGGALALTETRPATSTAMTLDWSATGPQVDYQIGTSATTITIINATTTAQAGSRKLVVVCNPGSTASTVAWTGVEWAGGTAPTQTTTASQCDAYSFFVTAATSTSAYKVFGAASTGFK